VLQPKRPVQGFHIRMMRTAFRQIVVTLGPWFIALAMLTLRATCRVRIHNDPRPMLRSHGEAYVYSVLHAHQIAAATCRERGTAAMVSQSKDGDFVALGLKLVGIKTVRGSSCRMGEDKGGLSALTTLVEHVRTGHPAYLAVDGPRGPRNRVHKGIALLSQRTGAAVLNVVAVPSRRWIFTRSWDRFQIPKPFSRIDIFVAATIWPQQDERVEEYRRRIEQSLCQLETLRDPVEADIATARHEHRQRKGSSATSAA
jgi:lysophospholipid acyltransferase (LPLAT)-like uncharacterized protein